MIKRAFIAFLSVFFVAASASAASGDNEHHMQRSIVGCQSQAIFDKIATIASEGDTKTAERLLAAGLKTGECVMLKKGETVYLEDMTTDYRLAKVRPKGDVSSYWTGFKFITW